MDLNTATVDTTTSIYSWERGRDVPSNLIQKDIFEVCIQGRTILVSVVCLVFAVHALPAIFASILIATLPLPSIIHNDYRNFLALGPGGIPSTFSGYCSLKFLSFFTNPRPFDPPLCPPELLDTHHHLCSWLPKRNGPRPRVVGIAPQRQLNQPGCLKTYHVLRTTLNNLTVRHPSLLRVGQSCFEKRGMAVFARKEVHSTCRGEICHVHHTDQSFHMCLHPEDSKVVLAKGWGQRHPLATDGKWANRFSVPSELMMIYAPRDECELEIVLKIVEAAAWWVSGERFNIEAERKLLQERGLPVQ